MPMRSQAPFRQDASRGLMPSSLPVDACLGGSVVDANTGDRSMSSESGPDAALMARALAGLYIAGATMVVLTLVLPRDVDASLGGSIFVAGLAYLVGFFLYFTAGRFPWQVPAVLLALGTLLHHRRRLLRQPRAEPADLLLPVGADLLGVLLPRARSRSPRSSSSPSTTASCSRSTSPPNAIAWWVVGMGSMLVATVLTAAMRDRGEVLVASLMRTARRARARPAGARTAPRPPRGAGRGADDGAAGRQPRARGLLLLGLARPAGAAAHPRRLQLGADRGLRRASSAATARTT